MRSLAGQSLLELALVLSLLASLAVVSSGTIQVASRFGLMAERHIDVQHNLRRGLDRVTEELRWAETVIADPQCGLCPDRVTARIPSFNPRRPGQAYVVTFRLDRREGELERVVGGSVTNLAAEVGSVEFRYIASNGRAAGDASAAAQVEILLTGRKEAAGISAQLAGAVFLRNHLSASPAR